MDFALLIDLNERIRDAAGRLDRLARQACPTDLRGRLTLELQNVPRETFRCHLLFGILPLEVIHRMKLDFSRNGQLADANGRHGDMTEKNFHYDAI